MQRPRDRSTRRRVDCARKTCWKGNNASGAQFGSCEDRCVAPHRAVHKVVFADAERMEGSGIAALAIIASTAGPEERQTAVPPRFVAITCTGIIASSRFAKGKVAFEQSSQIGWINQMVGTAKDPTTLRSVKGNTSCRRSVRQIVSSFSIPAGLGALAK